MKNEVMTDHKAVPPTIEMAIMKKIQRTMDMETLSTMTMGVVAEAEAAMEAHQDRLCFATHFSSMHSGMPDAVLRDLESKLMSLQSSA